LVYFVAIWYIIWLFGIFLPVLVCCTKKNLATLVETRCANLKKIFVSLSYATYVCMYVG
jgi:hypothetical protein